VDTSLHRTFALCARLPDAYTDSLGEYFIDSLDSGTYAVEAAGANGRRLLMRAHATGENALITMADDTLRPCASLKGELSAPESLMNGVFVSTFGLERIAATDSAGGFLLESIPQGQYRLLLQARAPGWRTDYIQSGLVLAGETKDLGNFAFSSGKALMLPETGFFNEPAAAPRGPFESCPENRLLDQMRVMHVRLPYESYAGSPLLLTETPYGMGVLWSEFEAERIHFSQLDTEGNFCDDDLVIEGKTGQGLLADDRGIVALVTDSSAMMWYVRVNWDGKTVFRRALIDAAAINSGYSAAQIGNVNKLYPAGKGFAAYFTLEKGSTRCTDRLVFLDAHGNICTGGWDFGCSNSYAGGRLAINGAFTASACLANGYPGNGIYYSVVQTAPDNCPSRLIKETSGGKSNLPAMGQIQPAADSGFWFVYIPDDSGSDVTLARLSPGGGAVTRKLTNTPAIDEEYPRLGGFADGYLVSWSAEGEVHFLRLDKNGDVVGEIEGRAFSAEQGVYYTRHWSQIVHFSNGDAGWVYKAGGDEFYISRIRACR